ncbi:MAG: hypothetical protein N3D17_00745 [bacterium]|nr:hypothetical protein [bacterium]
MKISAILLFICVMVFNGFSQEIKLPEEQITGEDIRFEKTRLFPFPVPQFNIIIPELRKPVKNDEIYRSGEGYLSLFLGSNTTFGNTLYYHSSDNKEAGYHLNIGNIISEGTRDNNQRKKVEIDFQRIVACNELSLKLISGDMELPGPEGHPFSNIQRSFFSFHTDYTSMKSHYITPSIKQHLYIIDNRDINFTTLNFSLDRNYSTWETGIERYDVFNNDFSSTSFYQSIYKIQDNLSLGGTLKIIERYGVRFLPSFRYNLSEYITLKISGTYQIPDLYKDILSEEYKEITNYNFAPEEEYRVSIAFHKRFKDGYIYLDISPSYRDNFYGWADIDKNGLFEPYPQNYWQTAINLELQYSLADCIKWFLKGEKRFISEDLDYYPEETLNTGLILKYGPFSFSPYISYTGERRFSGKKSGSVPVVNAEILFQKGTSMEWGVSVYNITDREYSIVPGYPAEGINLMSFIKIFF